MVWHSESLLHESFNQEAPVIVIFTEIYRTVHGFHSPGSQPFPGSIKEDEGSLSVFQLLRKIPDLPLAAGLADDLILSINAAIRPMVIPAGSLRIHRTASPWSEGLICLRIEN